MRLTISKEGDHFLVDDRTKTGSPPVGRGRTMMEAVGCWLHHNRGEVGIEFDVDPSAMPTEHRRRAREMRKR